MTLAEAAGQQRRSILFLLAIVALGGALSAFGLPVALFPHVTFPRVAITIDSGDRPADQMIAQVTRRVEQALKSVPNVLDVRSTTSRGSAEVNVAFAWGQDMDIATLQIRSALAGVLPSLPARTSFDVRRMQPTIFPVAAYSLTSDNVSLVRLHEIAQYDLVPLLSSIPGVAAVTILGGNVREFRIAVSPALLAAHDLSMDDVVLALSKENVLAVTGRVDARHKLLLAVADARVRNLEDIEATVVKATPKGVTKVSDIAEVTDNVEPNYTIVTADGHRAVLLQVIQQPGGNTVQIIHDVNATLNSFQSKLPKGVRIANWYDQSELIVSSARSVFDAVLFGVGLAAIVLFVFLRSFKITFITIITVPAVLAITVLLLAVLGMSFNIMTLGGMAAAIGLIIDDAIVMIEQIAQRVTGDDGAKRQQIQTAAREFLVPLTGSSMATAIIFLPLAFLSGVTGAFFKSLSLTMAAALIVSYLVAWFVVPLLADQFLSERDAKKETQAGVMAPILKVYRSAYLFLRDRLLILGLLASVPVLLGLFAFTQVGSGFMPHMDEGGFVLDYVAPPGTSLEDTDQLLTQVEDILRSTPEVQTYSRRTGAQLGGGLTEANTGDFFVRLKPQPRRPIDEIIAEVHHRVETMVPGLRVELPQLMEDLIGDLTSVPQPIEIKIYGDDWNELLRIAPKVAEAIGKVRGITEIFDGVTIAGDALNIQIDPVRASLEGIDPDGVRQQIETYLTGAVATSIQNGERTIGIRVWIPTEERATPDDVGRLVIAAPDGHRFMLRRIAKIGLLTGQPEITRDNLKPMVAVTARIEGRDLGSTARELRSLLAKSQLFPGNTYFELGGLYQQQQIAFRGLMVVLVAAFALVFLLLLVLYKSFDIAITIIAMPLLAMGPVFVGLWITGTELNITALMGMTMIVGIVTEVAIFYMSEYGTLRDQGVEVEDALLEAGMIRFRPIAMTTLAAILALSPLAVGLGQGSQMQQPLAIAIISGLIAQLPLVLLVMPLVLGAWRRRGRVST